MSGTNRRFSRRTFIVGLATAGAYLAACSPSQPATPTPAPTPATTKPAAAPTQAAPPKAEAKPSVGEVTIEVWPNAHIGGIEAIWGKIAREFESRNPGVKVKELCIPHNEAEAKILTSIAGNVPLDLVYVHPMWCATFATKSTIVDIDSYVKKDWTAAQLDDFYGGAIAYFNWDRKLWAMPYYSGPNTWYYNKDLLKQAGLEDPWDLYKKGEWTLQKFAEYAAKLTSGSGQNKVYGASEVSRTIRVQSVWLWGHGGDVWSEDMKQTVINSDGACKGWDYLADLVKKGIAPTRAESAALPGGEIGAFNSARIAFYYNIRGNVYNFKQGVNYGVAPHHKMPDGKEYNRDGPNALGITKLSKHRDSAWEFLKFSVGRGNEIMVEGKASAPVSRSVAKGKVWAELMLPWENAEVYDIAAKQVENKVLAHLPGMSEMDKLIQSAYDRIVLGEATSKQAMSEAKPKVDLVLKEQMAK
mgnify:CR=1 FL=1